MGLLGFMETKTSTVRMFNLADCFMSREGRERTTYESSSIVLKERGDFGQQLQPNDVPLVGTVPGVAFVISCPQNEVALKEASGFGFVSILEVVAVGLDMMSAIDTS